MRRRRFIQVMVLALMVAIGRVGLAADFTGEWVGKLVTKGSAEATATTTRVLLKATGSRLSGTWGSYMLAGSIEEGHVELTLTDASGAMVAEMRGRVGDDTLYGSGAMQPAKGSGSAEWTAVTWSLVRAAN